MTDSSSFGNTSVPWMECIFLLIHTYTLILFTLTEDLDSKKYRKDGVGHLEGVLV